MSEGNWVDEMDEFDESQNFEGALADANRETNKENEPKENEPKENEPDAKRPRGRPPKPKDDSAIVDMKKILKQKDTEIALLKKESQGLKDSITMLKDSDLTKHAEIVKLQNVNNNLQKLIASKDEEILLLHDDHDHKDKQVKDLTDKLRQKQMDYEDILEQMDAMDCSNLSLSASVNKLNALLIVDNATAPLANFLPEDHNWTVKRLSLSEVNCELLNQFDFVLFATGSVDMLEKSSWSDMLAHAKNAATVAIDASCLPVFIKLPPATTRPLSGKISLFNHRLSKVDKATILTPNIEDFAKSSFLKEDGIELSSSGAKLFIDLVRDKLSAIGVSDLIRNDSKSKCQPEISNDRDLRILVEVEKEKLGRVIGKGGHNLKAITSSNNVNIAVGYWCEKERNKDELKQIFSGMLISGKLHNIKNAESRIASIASDSY